MDCALRKVIDGKELELGLTLIEKRGRRGQGVSVCDLDFADDIVLLSNEIEQARKLLHNVEKECGKVGLGINAKKTKGMVFNVYFQPIYIVAGKEVGQALTESGNQDFLYLGSWSDRYKDIQLQKA